MQAEGVVCLYFFGNWLDAHSSDNTSIGVGLYVGACVLLGTAVMHIRPTIFIHRCARLRLMCGCPAVHWLARQSRWLVEWLARWLSSCITGPCFI